jgi:DNA-binding response OmpR family regulator
MLVTEGEMEVFNILVCDDEKDIVAALRIYLEASGEYRVFEAYSGAEAMKIMENEDVQLVLMDIMMPGTDGITATAKIREKSNVPIIMLTAKSEDSDKVLGLNIGADDYVTKPFNPVEVMARVKSQLRRYTNLGSWNGANSNICEVGGLCLDNDKKSVTVDGEAVSLTPIEYKILRFLMLTPGKVYSSGEIYRAIWKDEPYGSESAVAVHIRHIREKIEINPSEPRYLKVVWGQGYKVEKL